MPHAPTKQPTIPVMIDLTTISTPREHAVVATNGPVDLEVIAQATEANIRTLPIIDGDGPCGGAISVAKLAELAASKTALTPEHATTECEHFPHLVPVATLLRALADHGIVVHSGDPEHVTEPTWFGIVTTADLNKPIFRAHVYQMLVILETSLGQLIMDEFGDDWGAIRLLSEHTQGRIREFYEEEKAEGIELSPVTNATLSDLFFIATESHRVWNLMGFDAPAELRPIAHRINDLRNVIMHPVRPLIVNQQEMRDLVIAITDIESLTNAISKRIGAVGS